MIKQRFIVIMASCLCLFSSCMMILGVKDVKHPTVPFIKKLTAKKKMSSNAYYIDSSYIRNIGKRTSDKHILKNHLQPMQALYFNPEGRMVSYYINCYANPSMLSTHLKWNENNTFGQFPPKGNAPLDSLLTFSDLYSMLIPIGPNQLHPENYKVVVFWSRTFDRHSRHLIKQIKRNNQLTQNLDILYVNVDMYLKQSTK